MPKTSHRSHSASRNTQLWCISNHIYDEKLCLGGRKTFLNIPGPSGPNVHFVASPSSTACVFLTIKTMVSFVVAHLQKLTRYSQFTTLEVAKVHRYGQKVWRLLSRLLERGGGKGKIDSSAISDHLYSCALYQDNNIDAKARHCNTALAFGKILDYNDN